MSAPWEVWHSSKVGIYRDKDERRTIRYLRSDLTCGECAKCLLAFPEHGYICAYRRYPIGFGDVACMAFVPKEDK